MLRDYSAVPSQKTYKGKTAFAHLKDAHAHKSAAGQYEVFTKDGDTVAMDADERMIIVHADGTQCTALEMSSRAWRRLKFLRDHRDRLQEVANASH